MDNTMIHKYPLKLDTTQFISCRALQVLSIQIQNGRPVMWVLESSEAEIRTINVNMLATGDNLVEEFSDNYRYLATTQQSVGAYDSFVSHWFVYIDERDDDDWSIQVNACENDQ